ncbi:MAG TPA: hypothetical protein GXZ60_06835 [Intrasporangiaceae bacterium]|nr:hypothetical protein [Intrasporangiaceae bacterium]
MSNPPWMDRPDDADDTGGAGERPGEGAGPRPGRGDDPMRDIAAMFSPFAGGPGGSGGSGGSGGGGSGGGGSGGGSGWVRPHGGRR